MTAAVTPLEERCEVCHGTGSKERDLYSALDCTACEAATERVALMRALKGTEDLRNVCALTWRAYQLGKAATRSEAHDAGLTRIDMHDGAWLEKESKTGDWLFKRNSGFERYLNEFEAGFVNAALASKVSAAPVVPVAAQPVVQVPQLPFVIAPESMTALRRFYECALDGEGHDVPASAMKVLEGIGLVQRRRGSYYETTEFGLAVLDGKFAATHIEAQPAGEVDKPGMLKAADIIGEKANDYLNEFATTEHDTGAVVFLYGQDGFDYYNSLVELSEEIRAMAQGDKA